MSEDFSFSSWLPFNFTLGYKGDPDWKPGFRVRLILAWRRCKRAILGVVYWVTRTCPECHLKTPRKTTSRRHAHKFSCYFPDRKEWQGPLVHVRRRHDPFA